MPAIFSVDPPRINGDDPIVLTGAVLKNQEVHFLPAGNEVPPRRIEMADVTLYPAFGSFGILKRISESEPQDYYKTLWSKSRNIPVWIGSCDADRPFDDVLEAFSVTKFGGARLTHGNDEALITLGEAVELMGQGRMSTTMTTEEVASVPLAIRKDRPILEAVKKMLSLNVRRLFIEEGQGRFISDRTLVDYMFSPERLKIARDHPDRWIDEDVGKLGTKVPALCKSGRIREAASIIGPAPDDCLMTEEWRVVSRWDMVVKPWRAGRMRSEDN